MEFSRAQSFTLVMALVALMGFIIVLMAVSAPAPDYHVVTLNGVQCVVFDDVSGTGGETTELDRLRCPSATPVP